MKKLEALIIGDLKRESQHNDSKIYDKIVKRLGFIEEAARKTNCKDHLVLEKAVQESKIVAGEMQRIKLEQLENQSRLAVIQIQLNAVFVKVAKDLENFIALHTSEKERLSITLEKTVEKYKEEESRLREQISSLQNQKNKLLRQIATGFYSSTSQQTDEHIDAVSVDSLILLLEGIKQEDTQKKRIPSLSMSLKQIKSKSQKKQGAKSRTLQKGGASSGRISKLGSPNTKFFTSQQIGITEELLMKEREWK